MPPFAAWESFYVIIGSSAAALTGLQFVVITLGAEKRAGDSGTTRAFGTPTIVHFCAVLLVAAILSAPWPAVFGPAVALAACGVAGVIYVFIVISHTRRQTLYRPVMEDWLWHCVFPLIAYSTLVVSAATLPWIPTSSLFAIASTSLLLLFSGIHNAWDAVTYIAFTSRGTSDEQK